MTNAYNELEGLTVETAVAALGRQLVGVGKPGEIDLFGDARTQEDCTRALRELARVATKFADVLDGGPNGNAQD